MKKASFLNHDQPLLCAMVQEKTPDACIEMILNCLYDGAEAFGIQLECIERQFRTKEHLTSIFNACNGKPIYVTSYRNYESTGYTDEECMDYLLLAAECGATLLDVMGDTFDICPSGITYNEKAVARQKEIIKKIHDLGVEVLMSTHLDVYYDAEGVFDIAKEQEKRGADVVKIVNWSNDEKQLLENLDVCAKLKEVVNTEYLYLASGDNCRLLRQIGGRLGSVMCLCVYRYQSIYSKEQVILKSQKLIRDNLIV